MRGEFFCYLCVDKPLTIKLFVMKEQKNILLAIIALLLAVMAFKYLSQSNNSPAQPQEPVAIETQVPERYKIGDLYDVNGKEGVVFEVSADGKHGKIVSLTQPSKTKTWDEAFAWGRNLSGGWYLPSRDELLAIYKVKNKLNATLSAVGTELENWFYWSSTEYDEFCAWDVYLDDGFTSGSRKDFNHYVRAVSAF